MPTASANYDPGQLEWIAAINGMTPEQFISQGAGQQWIANGQTGTGLQDTLWDDQQRADADRARVQASTDATNARLGQLDAGYDPIINTARDRANYLQGLNGQLGQQVSDQATASNNMRLGALSGYGNAVQTAGAWDMQNFTNLQNAANAPMQMTASAYVGDAQSNPADVARQIAAYNQLQGIAGGSLDQVSRAANAYADAGDIQNQRAAAETLYQAGNGSLNVNLNNIRELDKLRDPGSIEGMSDLMNVYGGSQDIRVGQADPDAYAAAVDARNQLKGLTTPTVTAQEKLMYELSRQQQEQDESATRQALNTDAARRGMGGGGTTIARAALAAQQTSRNRMLQDMQANAQAQARAMDALQGYGTISTNMTAQANQIAAQNQATRVGALSQYTGVAANSASILGQIGSANATANANRQLAAQEAAYNAYATLRAQGFSEEYARGQAADAMANANANRRLAGAQSSGQMATDMRGQSDAMSRFNQSQRQQQQQFSDSYTANRQDAAYGRQVDVFNAGNTVGRNYMTDQGNLFNATTGVADSNFNTTNASVGTQMGLNGQWLGAQQTVDQQALGALGARAGIAQTQHGNVVQGAAINSGFGQQAVGRQTVLKGIGQQDAANAKWDATFNPGGGYNGTSITSPTYPPQGGYPPVASNSAGPSANPGDPYWSW